MSKQVRGLSWKGYEGQDYENFWTGPAKQHLDQLEQLIVSRSLPGGDTIIDIGAGFGRFGVCYVNRYTLAHLIEPANNLREIAAQTDGNDGVRYHEASVYKLPFGDSDGIDNLLHNLEILRRVPAAEFVTASGAAASISASYASGHSVAGAQPSNDVLA